MLVNLFQVILKEYPDAKIFHKHLTIGRAYTVHEVIGNGYKITTDDPELQLILLQSRFN